MLRPGDYYTTLHYTTLHYGVVWCGVVWCGVMLLLFPQAPMTRRRLPKFRAMVEVQAEAGEEGDSPAQCRKRMGASSESL